MKRGSVISMLEDLFEIAKPKMTKDFVSYFENRIQRLKDGEAITKERKNREHRVK